MNKNSYNLTKQQYLDKLRKGSTHYTGIGLRDALSRMYKSYNDGIRPHMAGSSYRR